MFLRKSSVKKVNSYLYCSLRVQNLCIRFDRTPSLLLKIHTHSNHDVFTKSHCSYKRSFDIVSKLPFNQESHHWWQDVQHVHQSSCWSQHRWGCHHNHYHHQPRQCLWGWLWINLLTQRNTWDSACLGLYRHCTKAPQLDIKCWFYSSSQAWRYEGQVERYDWLLFLHWTCVWFLYWFST